VEEKNLLSEFMKKFRLNCHYRFMFMPPEVEEIPYHIYKAAYEEAKEEVREKLVSDREENMIDNIYQSFINKLKDTEDYNIADEMMMKEIDSGNNFKNILEA